MKTIQSQANNYSDIAEVIIELNENERLCYCPHCHTLESLPFIGDRLAGGLNKWRQLPNGHIVHLCDMRFEVLTKGFL